MAASHWYENNSLRIRNLATIFALVFPLMTGVYYFTFFNVANDRLVNFGDGAPGIRDDVLKIWCDRLELASATRSIENGESVTDSVTEVMIGDARIKHDVLDVWCDRFASASDRAVRELRDQLEELKIEVDSILEVPNEVKIAINLDSVATTVADLNSRVTQLETVILDDPIKAISLPLLKKEIENLKESQIGDAFVLTRNIERVYDLSKWLIGGLSVSVVSLALVNFLGRRNTNEP